MAMHANYCLLDIGHILENPLDELSKLIGDSIAHGIRDIYCGRTSVNNRFQNLIDIFRLSSASVHRRELNIIGILLSPGHHITRSLQNLLTALF